MIQVYLAAHNNFIPVRNPELCKAIDSFTNAKYFRLNAIDPTGRKFYIDFSPALWNNDNFIDIDGKRFRYCEIEKNPDYVIALVEQESTRYAIEELPG